MIVRPRPLLTKPTSMRHTHTHTPTEEHGDDEHSGALGHPVQLETLQQVPSDDAHDEDDAERQHQVQRHGVYLGSDIFLGTDLHVMIYNANVFARLPPS